jgi:hypothetical protein
MTLFRRHTELFERIMRNIPSWQFFQFPPDRDKLKLSELEEISARILFLCVVFSFRQEILCWSWSVPVRVFENLRISGNVTRMFRSSVFFHDRCRYKADKMRKSQKKMKVNANNSQPRFIHVITWTSSRVFDLISCLWLDTRIWRFNTTTTKKKQKDKENAEKKRNLGRPPAFRSWLTQNQPRLQMFYRVPLW